MNAIQNVVKACKDLVGAGINIVGATAQVAADGAELVKDSIGEAVPVGKAVLSLPFAATEGYLVQEGLSQEEAHTCAYRFVKQPLSVTIVAAGVGSGKLLADLLKEDLTDGA